MTNKKPPDVIGWKAIAKEFDITERTARRWWKTHGMPVLFRFGRAVAHRSALHAWHDAACVDVRRCPNVSEQVT